MQSVILLDGILRKLMYSKLSYLRIHEEKLFFLGKRELWDF